MKRLLLIWTLAAGPVVNSLAQPAQSIQALVDDASGAVVAGANVTVKNTPMGITRNPQTNTAGLYSFQLVQVGDYTLKAETTGFNTESLSNVRVETSDHVRLDSKLEVGSVADNIEVSSNSVQLNTENAKVGGVMGETW